MNEPECRDSQQQNRTDPAKCRHGRGTDTSPLTVRSQPDRRSQFRRCRKLPQRHQDSSPLLLKFFRFQNSGALCLTLRRRVTQGTVTSNFPERCADFKVEELFASFRNIPRDQKSRFLEVCHCAVPTLLMTGGIPADQSERQVHGGVLVRSRASESKIFIVRLNNVLNTHFPQSINRGRIRGMELQANIVRLRGS